jgi:hypothetical protein
LFDVTRGGVVCRACGGGLERMSAALRLALMSAFEGAALDALCDELTPLQLQDAERLVSLFIAQLLQREHKLEKRH